MIAVLDPKQQSCLQIWACYDYFSDSFVVYLLGVAVDHHAKKCLRIAKTIRHIPSSWFIHNNNQHNIWSIPIIAQEYPKLGAVSAPWAAGFVDVYSRRQQLHWHQARSPFMVVDSCKWNLCSKATQPHWKGIQQMSRFVDWKLLYTDWLFSWINYDYIRIDPVPKSGNPNSDQQI